MHEMHAWLSHSLHLNLNFADRSKGVGYYFLLKLSGGQVDNIPTTHSK